MLPIDSRMEHGLRYPVTGIQGASIELGMSLTAANSQLGSPVLQDFSWAYIQFRDSDHSWSSHRITISNNS